MLAENATQTLTQVEWTEEDFEQGERIARSLGYWNAQGDPEQGTNTAYTSTSALWGLFCLPFNPKSPDYRAGQATEGGCIIKTRELGFLFVQDGEDRHRGYDWSDA